MKQITAEVIANVEVVPNVFLMRLLAPEIARYAEPGQFIHLCVGDGTDPLLRRPISLHRIGNSDRSDTLNVALSRREREQRIASPSERGRRSEAEPGEGPFSEHWRPNSGEISLLFARVGKGTALLGRLRPGDTLSVVGPLGSGFKLEPKTRNVLLVAGGLGIAPLAALADEAIKREMTVTLLAGARNEASVMPAALLPPEIEYVVCTDDGSRGRPGVVTHVVPEFIDWADQVFACGPRPMIDALAALRLEGRLSTSKSVQVALEQHMACGVGACLGCVVRTKKGLQRVCRDGPVFKLGDLAWT